MWTRASKLLVPLLITFSLGCALMSSDKHPEYTIKPVKSGTIVVDGQMDEAWKHAEVIDEFVFPWWESGEKEATEARLLWDRENLYVLFIVKDVNIAGKATARDGHVFLDDCVEIFISPDPTSLVYYNFEFNALGAWLDQSSNREKGWNPDGLQYRVALEGTLNDDSDTDSEGRAEIAIPFAAFGKDADPNPPVGGTAWRFNVYRISDPSNPQYSAWSPPQTEEPNFHRPVDFGYGRFDISHSYPGHAAASKVAAESSVPSSTR